jgi:hypothetical protein
LVCGLNHVKERNNVQKGGFPHPGRGITNLYIGSFLMENGNLIAYDHNSDLHPPGLMTAVRKIKRKGV